MVYRVGVLVCLSSVCWVVCFIWLMVLVMWLSLDSCLI